MKNDTTIVRDASLSHEPHVVKKTKETNVAPLDKDIRDILVQTSSPLICSVCDRTLSSHIQTKSTKSQISCYTTLWKELQRNFPE